MIVPASAEESKITKTTNEATTTSNSPEGLDETNNLKDDEFPILDIIKEEEEKYKLKEEKETLVEPIAEDKSTIFDQKIETDDLNEPDDKINTGDNSQQSNSENRVLVGDGFKVYFTADNKIDYLEEYENGKLVRIFTYFDDAVYGVNHGSKINTIYHVKSDGQIIYSRVNNSKQEVINYYEYYTPTYFNKGHGSRIKVRYNVHPTGLIKDAVEYNTNGEISKAYEYYSAWYGDGHENLIKKKYELYPSALIKYAIEYDKNTQKPTKRYEYNRGWYGDNHEATVSNIVYFLNNNETKIDYLEQYEGGKLVRIFSYFDDAIYGVNHGSKIKTIYYVKPNGEIIYSRVNNTKQEVINYYEYHEPTYFNKGHGSRIKFRFNVYPSGLIKDAIAFNLQGEITQAYEYYSAWYGDGHGSLIKKRYELYPNALIKHAIEYDKNTQKPIRRYEYNSGWYGDGHESRISKIIDLTNESNDFKYPVDNRNAPVTTYVGHRGRDIAVGRNNNVYSMSDGVVVRVISGCVEGKKDCGGGFGNHVVVKYHRNGVDYYVYYAHLNSSTVSTGRIVSAGDLIGKTGSTGFSTGPHLHVEIRPNDKKATSDETAIDFRDFFNFR